MNDQEQRALIHFLAERFKETMRELMAYQLFAAMLKAAEVVDVEKILENARQSPRLRERFDRNFEGFEEILPPSPKDTQNEEIRQLLEKWNPGGKPN